MNQGPAAPRPRSPAPPSSLATAGPRDRAGPGWGLGGSRRRPGRGCRRLAYEAASLPPDRPFYLASVCDRGRACCHRSCRPGVRSRGACVRAAIPKLARAPRGPRRDGQTAAQEPVMGKTEQLRWGGCRVLPRAAQSCGAPAAEQPDAGGTCRRVNWRRAGSCGRTGPCCWR